MKLNMVEYATLWVFGLAVAWAGAADTARGAAAALPPEAREQLEKQKTALRSLYIEYEETVFRNDRKITSTNTAYFEGDRFLINEGHDIAFDGEVMWSVTIKPSTDGQSTEPHFTLRKTKIKNTSETTTTLRDLYWKFPYFEAAGIYCPKYPGDLRKFRSLEPMALRFLENSDSTQIVQEGANLRVTCYIDDWVLVNFRQLDPVIFRKELERTALSPKRISNEMEVVKHARGMVPKRKVSMLLDPKHGYAPAEREDRTADGQLIARFKVEDWKYFQDVALWLPSRCLVSYFTNPWNFDKFAEEPVLRLLINLKSAEFGKRKTEFTLIKTPKYKVGGTWVYDEAIMETTKDGVKTPVILTVAADGSLLNSGGSMVQASGNRRLWILIMLFILAVPPILAYIWRSRSKG